MVNIVVQLVFRGSKFDTDHFGGFPVSQDYYTPDREPSLTESFTCEYCDKPFIIEATVTYKTKEEVPEKDFQEQYVSLLD